MTKFALALAAGTVLGAMGLTAASAAPAMPSAPVVAGETMTTQVMHRHHHRMRHHHMGRHHSMRHGMRSRMMGDPNSRNPSQPGYMQRKGTTSGGPRY